MRSRGRCWWWTRARSPPPSRPGICSGWRRPSGVPRVVLVGDEKQLDAVDAGKPFAQLQRAGPADGGDGRDPAPARSGTEGSGRSQSRGRCGQGFREARVQCRGSEGRQHRGRGRRALAEAVAGGEGEHRRDGAEPRTPSRHQRAHQGAAGARRHDPWPRLQGREAGLPRLHQGGEGSCRQLCAGRRGGVPSPLQAARGRQRRRAPGGRGRSSKWHGDAERQGRRSCLMAAECSRRQSRRRRGLSCGGDRAPGRRPRALDPERQGLRPGQQPDRRSGLGKAGPRLVAAPKTGGRWRWAGTTRNCATSIMRGRRPCTRSRDARWTMSSRRWRPITPT